MLGNRQRIHQPSLFCVSAGIQTQLVRLLIERGKHVGSEQLKVMNLTANSICGLVANHAKIAALINVPIALEHIGIAAERLAIGHA